MKQRKKIIGEQIQDPQNEAQASADMKVLEIQDNTPQQPQSAQSEKPRKKKPEQKKQTFLQAVINLVKAGIDPLIISPYIFMKCGSLLGLLLLLAVALPTYYSW